MGEPEKLIYAIDQGTSSTRVIVFNLNWEVVTQHQVEFQSIYPEEGWCEQDPKVLLDTVKTVSVYFYVKKMKSCKVSDFYSALKKSLKI